MISAQDILKGRQQHNIKIVGAGFTPARLALL